MLLILVFHSADIDECATSYPCDHNCSNAFGSFSCSCIEGFQLQTNGRTCSSLLHIFGN